MGPGVFVSLGAWSCLFLCLRQADTGGGGAGVLHQYQGPREWGTQLAGCSLTSWSDVCNCNCSLCIIVPLRLWGDEWVWARSGPCSLQGLSIAGVGCLDSF